MAAQTGFGQLSGYLTYTAPSINLPVTCRVVNKRKLGRKPRKPKTGDIRSKEKNAKRKQRVAKKPKVKKPLKKEPRKGRKIQQRKSKKEVW